MYTLSYDKIYSSIRSRVLSISKQGAGEFLLVGVVNIPMESFVLNIASIVSNNNAAVEVQLVEVQAADSHPSSGDGCLPPPISLECVIVYSLPLV